MAAERRRSALPAHVLTGYWQDFTNGAQALKLSEVPTRYDLVAVAFANADPSNPGGVTFSVDSGLSSALGGYTDAQFTSDIATLHSRGQKVIISVGGQNGTISVGDSDVGDQLREQRRRPDQPVRLRRRRHRPGERRQPDLHGAGAALDRRRRTPA